MSMHGHRQREAVELSTIGAPPDAQYLDGLRNWVDAPGPPELLFALGEDGGVIRFIRSHRRPNGTVVYRPDYWAKETGRACRQPQHDHPPHHTQPRLPWC